MPVTDQDQSESTETAQRDDSDDETRGVVRELGSEFETTSVDVDLDPVRTPAYLMLVEEFGQEFIDNSIQAQVDDFLVELFDNRDELRRELAQAPGGQPAQSLLREPPGESEEASEDDGDGG